MSLVLSLETSTDVCSVALHNKNVLLKHVLINEPQAHASRLAPMIHDLLAETETNPKALKAIAVSSGPGSYTGLRIGASTAKGLCYALGIPLISIPTLKIIAHEALKMAHAGEWLCPMIDARRMEVYCQTFDQNLVPKSEVEAMVVDALSFNELLQQRHLLFVGNGAAKCKGVIENASARFIDSILPSAISLGELAWTKFEKSEFENLNTFKPFYLKEFVAKKAQPLL